MKPWLRALLLQVWFFVGFPLLGAALIAGLGIGGVAICCVLIFFQIWQLFAYSHYRFCRQEEFVHVLQTATATQAPIESVLHAYLLDRPREHLYRAILLTCVFPGYYWIHRQRSFDVRLTRLAEMMDGGVPIDKALSRVPGVAPSEIALAIAVGQFTGKLDQAMKRLSERRTAPQWVDWMRLVYPLLILLAMASVTVFLMVFIIPKFERIYSEFKLKLPEATEILIALSRWFTKFSFVIPLILLGMLAVFNGLLISSRVRWYLPPVSYFYRMNQRGRFLQTLGTMLESGKPVPEILDYVVESGFLPSALRWRVERFALDLSTGEPFADSLVRHGLMPASMKGLVMSAEKAQNLPWALQELGESQVRGSARLSHRLSVVVFPLAVFACSCVIGFVAYAMFVPLTTLIDGVGQMK